ncbi:MAG: hypothetical protein Q4F95_05235 [Oscillospiraceae bacterium]|nr:hypothetical protein [Oscillospiraceae bacterium]
MKRKYDYYSENETADLLFVRGKFLIAFGLAAFTLFNIVWQIFKYMKYELQIGKGFIGNGTISAFFIVIMIIGSVISYIGCLKNKDKRTDRYLTITFITIGMLLLVIFGQLMVYGTTYSKTWADLPDGKKTLIVWEEHDSYNYINICEKHGIIAKKVLTVKTSDKSYSFDKNKSEGSYTVTVNGFIDDKESLQNYKINLN